MSSGSSHKHTELSGRGTLELCNPWGWISLRKNEKRSYALESMGRRHTLISFHHRTVMTVSNLLPVGSSCNMGQKDSSTGLLWEVQPAERTRAIAKLSSPEAAALRWSHEEIQASLARKLVDQGKVVSVTMQDNYRG
ncbi:hypothetical protein AAC387_Pa04g2177 [Persea americana]